MDVLSSLRGEVRKTSLRNDILPTEANKKFHFLLYEIKKRKKKIVPLNKIIVTSNLNYVMAKID